MRDNATWSVSVGRWAGIRVRIHIFYLLFAAFTMFLGWQASENLGGKEYIWLAGLSLVIHFVSVLLHEFSHCHAALRVGASVDYVVLVPWGGLAPIHAHGHPQGDLLISAAGPLSNLFVCLVWIIPLLFATGVERPAELLQLLHPLSPFGVVQGEVLTLSLKLVFWINWLLFLVNIFPVFPLDGGRVLRAGLLLSWPEMSGATATARIARGAQCAAVGLFIVACLVRDAGPAGPVPTWFALVLLSIFLFFAAQHEIERRDEEEHDDELFGYEFSQGYSSLDEHQASSTPPRPGAIARWIEKWKTQAQQRKQEQEAEEERRMDEILSRLNKTGLKGLSEEERRLLDRVSARYRSRQDS